MKLSVCKIIPLSVISICFFSLSAAGQTPSFILKDTVCTNTPLTIANTSVGGTTYYWNFCDADLNQTPQAVNLGNISGLLSQPVFMDVVSQNNNYYAFLTNHFPGNLLRLDFGNSMLNTPVATNLGNFGGIINSGYGTEGIQVVNNNGNWYAIIVGGNPASSSVPKIVQVNFGPDITNPTPVATDWGNLGNLIQPMALYVFKENSNWYGFTVNAVNNTITRFDFGNNFNNPPSAANLGNPGNFLNYPTGIYALNDAGNWHVFITNGNTSALVRLDFGTSLLNTPAATNLGNPGNALNFPRSITILKLCNQIIGFCSNNSNDIVKVNFNNDLLSVPTATSLGNIGNLSVPHSISKLFRVGSDLYSFIPNVSNNTLTRVKFSGCNNSSIPNSVLKDPPTISYSQPGSYGVNLIMDDGLATQSSFCKNITVLSPPVKLPPQDSSFCGDSMLLRSRFITPEIWNDGSSKDSLLVKLAGDYWVNTNFYGCTVRDSFAVSNALPSLKTIKDTFLCKGSTVLLKTDVQHIDSLRWAPATGLSDPALANPIASPTSDVSYIIAAYHKQCIVRDTILVKVKDTPVITISNDTLICTGGKALLVSSGAENYQWYPSAGLLDSTLAYTIAAPSAPTLYHLKGVGANGCTTYDSVLVDVKKPAIFSLKPARASICIGDSLFLQAKGGDTYRWINGDIGSQNPSFSSVVVSPGTNTNYQVIGFDTLCNTRDTLISQVSVLSKPEITVSKSNDIDCVKGESLLKASGGIKYAWYPLSSLSDPYIADPVARPDTNMMYYLAVTGQNGCLKQDSIQVFVSKSSNPGVYPVANAFTPNGDGVNDCFGVKYWGYIGQFEMAVYNRWGQRVFYSKNAAQCWDGRFNGIMQPPGTYVYTIKAGTLCGNAIKKGTVLLVR